MFSQEIGKCGDFGSWWQKTKNGNEICNEKGSSGYFISIKCKDFRKSIESGYVISDIDKWYFYKNYIVGESIKIERQVFFIFNEITCEHQVFQKREEFDKRINEIGLRPMIWTRWYKENWGYIITSGNFGDQLYFTFVIVPILFIVGLVTLIGLMRTGLDLKHKFNKAALIIVSMILVRILLDLFPGSI